jgi:hypothetical protein
VSNFPSLERLGLRGTTVDFPTSWLSMTEIDIRGLQRPFLWTTAGNMTNTARSYGTRVDGATRSECSAAVEYGDMSRYHVVTDPEQYAYRFCVCLDGFFGDISSDNVSEGGDEYGSLRHRACTPCPVVTGASGSLSLTATCSGGRLVVGGGAVVVDVAVAAGDGGAGNTSLITAVPCPSDSGGESPCVRTVVTRTPPPTAEAMERAAANFFDSSTGSSSLPGRHSDEPATTTTLAAMVEAFGRDGVSTECRVGYEGRLCAQCTQGHYASGRTCRSCHTGTWWIKPAVSVAVILVLTLRVLGGGAVARSGLFRTLTFHMQLFAALPHQSLLLPSAIRGVFSGSEAATAFQLEGLECMEGAKHWDGFFAPLVLAWCLPLVVALGAGVSIAVSLLAQRLGPRARAESGDWRPLGATGDQGSLEGNQDRGSLEGNRDQGSLEMSGDRGSLGTSGVRGSPRPQIPPVQLALGYLWLLLMFTSVRRVLAALNCTQYGNLSGGARFVSTALWVECSAGRAGSTYSAVVALSVILGIAFVVCTALAVSLPLYRAHRGGDGFAAVKWNTSPWTAYLVAPYDESSRWWEAVQVSKRLAIAVLQALAPFQSAVLPVGVSLVLVSSILLQSWRKPFLARIDNVAESISATLLLLMFMAGLVVSNATYASRGVEGVAWLVVIANLLFVAWAVMALFWRKAAQLRGRSRTRGGKAVSGASGGGGGGGDGGDYNAVDERAVPLILRSA